MSEFDYSYLERNDRATSRNMYANNFDSTIMGYKGYTFFNVGVHTLDFQPPTTHGNSPEYQVMDQAKDYSMVIVTEGLSSAPVADEIFSITDIYLSADGAGSFAVQHYEDLVFGETTKLTQFSASFKLNEVWASMMITGNEYPVLNVDFSHALGPTAIMLVGTPKEYDLSTAPPVLGPQHMTGVEGVVVPP